MQSVILKKQQLKNLVFPVDLDMEARKEELLQLGQELNGLLSDLDSMGNQLGELDMELDGLDEEFDSLNRLLDEATDSLVNFAVQLKEELKLVVDEMKEEQQKGGIR